MIQREKQDIISKNGKKLTISLFVNKSTGKDILYFHGLFGFKEKEFIENLSPKFNVIVPELPGYGSTSEDSGFSTILDYALFIDDFLASRNLSNVIGIGHSLGAMILLEVASLFPDKFSKLIFICPYGIWDDNYTLADPFTLNPDELSECLYMDQESVSASEIRELPTARVENIDQNTKSGQNFMNKLLDRARALTTAASIMWPIPDSGVSERLYRINSPTLILMGEKDGLINPEYGEKLKKLIKGSELKMIENSAHMMVEEDPERFVQIILEFLK